MFLARAYLNAAMDEGNGEIQVFDVWESQEAFEAFGATLVPIMTELGIDPGEPMVSRVHNVIKG